MRGRKFYEMLKITEALPVGKERYFDSEVENMQFARCSVGLNITSLNSHSSGICSGTRC
jgi:hypothetical protein